MSRELTGLTALNLDRCDVGDSGVKALSKMTQLVVSVVPASTSREIRRKKAAEVRFAPVIFSFFYYFTFFFSFLIFYSCLSVVYSKVERVCICSCLYGFL